MTYSQLIKAFYQTFNGPVGPELCQLSVNNKSGIARIFAHTQAAVIGPYNELVEEDVYVRVMQAPWVMFKGTMMMFDQRISNNTIRFWMPDGKLKEITLENADANDKDDKDDH